MSLFIARPFKNDLISSSDTMWDHFIDNRDFEDKIKEPLELQNLTMNTSISLGALTRIYSCIARNWAARRGFLATWAVDDAVCQFWPTGDRPPGRTRVPAVVAALRDWSNCCSGSWWARESPDRMRSSWSASRCRWCRPRRRCEPSRRGYAIYQIRNIQSMLEWSRRYYYKMVEVYQYFADYELDSITLRTLLSM